MENRFCIWESYCKLAKDRGYDHPCCNYCKISDCKDKCKLSSKTCEGSVDLANLRVYLKDPTWPKLVNRVSNLSVEDDKKERRRLARKLRRERRKNLNKTV